VPGGRAIEKTGRLPWSDQGRNRSYTQKVRISAVLPQSGHARGLPGSPDIVFPGRRKVVFVHGCFWHGHGCKRGDRMPQTNVAYWSVKIAGNRVRDVRVRRKLRAEGWSALTVWECQLKHPAALIARIKQFLEG